MQETISKKNYRSDSLKLQEEELQQQIKKARLCFEKARCEVITLEENIRKIESRQNDPVLINLFDFLPLPLIELCEDYANQQICRYHGHLTSFFSRGVECIFCFNHSITCELQNDVDLSGLQKFDLLRIETLSKIFTISTLDKWSGILEQIKYLKYSNCKKRMFGQTLRDLIRRNTLSKPKFSLHSNYSSKDKQIKLSLKTSFQEKICICTIETNVI